MKNNTKKFIIPLLLTIVFIFLALVIFFLLNPKKEPKLSLEEEIYNLRSDIIPRIYSESKTHGLDKRKDEIDSKNRQRDADIRSLIDQLIIPKEQLSNKENELSNKENELSNKKNELKNKEDELNRIPNLIEAKEQQLISQRNELNSEQRNQIENELHELRINSQRFPIRIQRLREDIPNIESNISVIKTKIVELKEQINKLKKEIEKLKEKIWEENKIKYKFENYLLLRSFYISVEKIFKFKEEMDSFLQELNKYNSSFSNTINNLNFKINIAKTSSELINLYTSNKLLFPFLDSIKKDFEIKEYNKKEQIEFDKYIKLEKNDIEKDKVSDFKIDKLEDKRKYFQKVIQMMDNIEKEYEEVLKLSDYKNNYIKEKIIPYLEITKQENNKVTLCIKNDKEVISENIFELKDNTQNYVLKEEDSWKDSYKNKFKDKFESSLTFDEKQQFYSENRFREFIENFVQKNKIQNDNLKSRKFIYPLGLKYCLKDPNLYDKILYFLVKVMNEFLEISIKLNKI